MYCLPPWMYQVERHDAKILSVADQPQPQDKDATAQSNDNDAVSTATHSAMVDDTGSATSSIATVPTDNICSTKQKQKKNNDQVGSYSPPLSNKLQKRREKKERMKNSPADATSNQQQQKENICNQEPSSTKQSKKSSHASKPGEDTTIPTRPPNIRRTFLLHLLLPVLLFSKMIFWTREKSALAKEKKKSHKSKKHDKWIKEQEAEKASRAKGWYVYVCMYVYVVCSELYAFVSAMLQMI